MRTLQALPVFALLGCNNEFAFPPQVAESKYIIYYTDADASVLCMDDLLSRDDEFIEHTATLLGIDPPDSPVDYIWNPERDDSEPWICPNGDLSCYGHRQDDHFSVVISDSVSNRHELVHAVDVQGLGRESHPTLREGLAEYLGSLKATPPSSEFSKAFKAMLSESPHPSNYQLAQHFVGSLVEQHGAQKVLLLRSEMPEGAGIDEFARVFEDVFSQELDDALAEMNGKQIFAQGVFPGCEPEGTQKISWSSENSIDAQIESECGDPWFYGPGFVDGSPGFFGRYQIEITKPGNYELTVEGSNFGSLTGCSFEMLTSAIASIGGKPGRGALQAGLHMLAITFPPGPEPRGESKVRLVYLGGA